MRLLNPLFALIGVATDPQLARMVEYLKAEIRQGVPAGDESER